MGHEHWSLSFEQVGDIQRALLAEAAQARLAAEAKRCGRGGAVVKAARAYPRPFEETLSGVSFARAAIAGVLGGIAGHLDTIAGRLDGDVGLHTPAGSTGHPPGRQL